MHLLVKRQKQFFFNINWGIFLVFFTCQPFKVIPHRLQSPKERFFADIGWKKMKELISQAFKLKFYEEKSLFSWYHPITIKASRFDTEKFFQSQFSEAKVLDNTLRHSFTPSIDFSTYLLKGLYHGSEFWVCVMFYRRFFIEI